MFEDTNGKGGISKVIRESIPNSRARHGERNYRHDVVLIKHSVDNYRVVLADVKECR